MQIPDEFFRGIAGGNLPPAGAYGVGVVFLPAGRGHAQPPRARHHQGDRGRGPARGHVARRARPTATGAATRRSCTGPYVKHVIIAAEGALAHDQDAFERKLYVIRRVAELAGGTDLVIPTMSSRTIVYKGMLTPIQLRGYFLDLQDERVKTAVALVHSPLLHEHVPELGARAPVPDDRPQRRDQHAARQRQLDARARVAAALRAVRRRPRKMLPVVRPGGSDSATLDNVLELLVLAGRSLPHAMMMLIPEAYEGRDDLLAAAQRLLRVPLVLHGAVGRAGRRRVHRRPRDRRDARPQRPAPRPLAGDQGRLGHPRVRGRHGRRARGQRRPQGPPGAGQALPRRPRRRAGSSPTREVKHEGRHAQALRRVVRGGHGPVADLPDRVGGRRSTTARSPSASSRSAGPRRTCGCCWRRWRATPPSRPARWATTSRWRCCRTSRRRCSPTSSSCSRR